MLYQHYMLNLYVTLKLLKKGKKQGKVTQHPMGETGEKRGGEYNPTCRKVNLSVPFEEKLDFSTRWVVFPPFFSLFPPLDVESLSLAFYLFTLFL